MAKRFALVSFGVLCLAVAALVLANVTTRDVHLVSVARASCVVSASGVVAHQDDYFLDQDGTVWRLSYRGDGVLEWQPLHTDLTPPVPVENIKLWGMYYLVTTDNVAWVLVGGVGGVWKSSPWPGEPVPTSPNTWGGVKDKYDGNK